MTLPMSARMKFSIVAFFLVFALPATAMDEAERKIQECRSNTRSLMGLDRDEVRSKCGEWDRSSVNFVDNRRVEMLVWNASGSGPVLVIYLGNGKVTGAQAN
jgi:hypothetical protein